VFIGKQRRGSQLQMIKTMEGGETSNKNNLRTSVSDFEEYFASCEALMRSKGIRTSFGPD